MEWKLTAVDDDTANGRSVAANPLRRAVYDDICAVLDGADEVSCAKLAHALPRRIHPRLTSHAEGVVDDQGDTVVMRDFRELRERSDVVLGVANALYVDGFRLIVDGGGEFRRVVAMNELDGNAETLQEYCEKLAKPP